MGISVKVWFQPMLYLVIPLASLGGSVDSYCFRKQNTLEIWRIQFFNCLVMFTRLTAPGERSVPAWNADPAPRGKHQMTSLYCTANSSWRFVEPFLSSRYPKGTVASPTLTSNHHYKSGDPMDQQWHLEAWLYSWIYLQLSFACVGRFRGNSDWYYMYFNL